MQINGIDEKDNQIVNLLLEDGRMSYSEIGERIGITRPAVKNRITALEKSGIISGYQAIINPQNSPEMMTFVVNIETDPKHFENTKERLSEYDIVVTMVQTTGNCHILAICVATDVAAMKYFVNRVYKDLEGIRSINANSVLDVIKGSIIPIK